MAGDSAAHWQRTYAEHQVGSLSWIEEAPGTSLELIAEAGLWSDAAVIDVGGGASRLAADGWRVLGTLPPEVDLVAIIDRAWSP